MKIKKVFELGKTKNWLGKMVSLLIYGILIFMVITLISSKLTGGKPIFLGHEILTVLSGSMEPDIKTGSIISVTPVSNTKELKKGDIITFKAADAPNLLITHRIIEIEKAGDRLQYITKGDNNDGRDSLPVQAENIVARYDHFTVPFIGYLLSFVKSKLGAVLMLIVPGAIMIICSIFSIWKSIKMMDTKKETPAS